MDYREFLRLHCDLQECLVLGYWWAPRRRDFVLLVDNIWASRGRMRPDLNAEDHVYVYMVDCLMVSIRNHFRPDVLYYPWPMPWGNDGIEYMTVADRCDGLLDCVLNLSGERTISTICQDVRVHRDER